MFVSYSGCFALGCACGVVATLLGIVVVAILYDKKGRK